MTPIGVGSRSGVNLHHPQPATAGDTSRLGTAMYFFTKAVFCKALSYGVLHSSSGGVVLKLRTFKGASLFMIFLKFINCCTTFCFDLVSVGAFLKTSDTRRSSHNFFPQKLYFVNLYHYGILHLLNGCLVLKLWHLKKPLCSCFFQFTGF